MFPEMLKNYVWSTVWRLVGLGAFGVGMYITWKALKFRPGENAKFNGVQMVLKDEN